MSKHHISEKAFIILEGKILETEQKLEDLEKALESVGHPADEVLQKRLQALRIEEEALKRNYQNLLNHPEDDNERLKKVLRLLHHIEREEASVLHEADFLAQAAPSSVTVAAAAATRVLKVLSSSFQKYFLEKRPLGESSFVNHTHRDLVRFHGLSDDDNRKAS